MRRHLALPLVVLSAYVVAIDMIMIFIVIRGMTLIISVGHDNGIHLLSGARYNELDHRRMFMMAAKSKDRHTERQREAEALSDVYRCLQMFSSTVR